MPAPARPPVDHSDRFPGSSDPEMRAALARKGKPAHITSHGVTFPTDLPPMLHKTRRLLEEDGYEDKETAAALRASQTNSGQAPVEAAPSNPAPQLVGNPGLSDENSFEAVSARQSIESDAARLQEQRSQYQQVQPTALPQQSGSTSPNIVKYALSTSHPVGTKLYSRAGVNLKARSARNCAGFASAELAQIAFLEAGGPRRDRKALDPDGDGYACGWDPSPYRLALRGNS